MTTEGLTAAIIGLLVTVMLFRWLTKKNPSKVSATVEISPFAILDIIDSNRCYQLQIPGNTKSKPKYELILSCINTSIAKETETNYWKEIRIEIDPIMFGLIISRFPNKITDKPVADIELKEILAFLINNATLQQIRLDGGKELKYRYVYLVYNLQISIFQANDLVEKILTRVNNYSEIFGELTSINDKKKIRHYLNTCIANNWRPKYYWY